MSLGLLPLPPTSSQLQTSAVLVSERQWSSCYTHGISKPWIPAARPGCGCAKSLAQLHRDLLIYQARMVILLIPMSIVLKVKGFEDYFIFSQHSISISYLFCMLQSNCCTLKPSYLAKQIKLPSLNILFVRHIVGFSIQCKVIL